MPEDPTKRDIEDATGGTRSKRATGADPRLCEDALAPRCPVRMAAAAEATHRSERSSLCSACRRAFRLHYQTCGQPQEIDALRPQASGRFSFQAVRKWPDVARMRERCWRVPTNSAEGSASRVNRPRAETGRNCSLALRAAGWVNNPRPKKGFRSERSSNMAGRRRSLGYEPVVGVVGGDLVEVATRLGVSARRGLPTPARPRRRHRDRQAAEAWGGQLVAALASMRRRHRLSRTRVARCKSTE